MILLITVGGLGKPGAYRDSLVFERKSATRQWAVKYRKTWRYSPQIAEFQRFSQTEEYWGGVTVRLTSVYVLSDTPGALFIGVVLPGEEASPKGIRRHTLNGGSVWNQFEQHGINALTAL